MSIGYRRVHVVAEPLEPHGAIGAAAIRKGAQAFELISRSYARKFAPKVTKEEYYLNEYLHESPENKMPALFAAFADSMADEESMREIEKMIKEWKKSKGIK